MTTCTMNTVTLQKETQPQILQIVDQGIHNELICKDELPADDVKFKTET